MSDRVSVRFGWGLGGVALVLLLLPLLINVMRGGASGVGVDPRTAGTDMLFTVTYPVETDPGPLSGKFHLIVSRTAEPEPRFQLRPGAREPYVFTRDVVAWRPGRPFELTDADPGESLPSIAHIPGGYYWVQGIFETDGGEPSGADASGEDSLGWATRPGNLVSRPVELFVDPRTDDRLRVHLARRIAGQPQ
jgi:hypothetical protein